MFRDRVVSMEQTLEGGEKHLPLLKDICREALPDFEYRRARPRSRARSLRDGAARARRRPRRRSRGHGWSSSTPSGSRRSRAIPAAELRGKIVEFLKARATRPEIVVTFRHLEEGWVDTPEPRREGGGGRRRRRGGRGGSRAERGGGAPDRRPGAPSPQRAPGGGERRPQGPRPATPRPAAPRPPAPARRVRQALRAPRLEPRVERPGKAESDAAGSDGDAGEDADPEAAQATRPLRVGSGAPTA